MFTLQNSFKPLLLKWGRGVKSLVELTVNSKEENSEDFCPNYIQEFGLCTMQSAGEHSRFCNTRKEKVL
jgi:hypothetical protein